MESMIGKWKGAFQSVLMTMTVEGTASTVIGCCCIPCIRGLPNLLIITAVGEPRAPGAFQAYVGVEYTLVGTNEMPGGGPDLMDLDYVD